MNQEAIDILKEKMNFDQLDKTRMTLSILDLLAEMESIVEKQKDGNRIINLKIKINIIQKYMMWAEDTWYAGNAANNLMLIFETQKIKLSVENEMLKAENKKLIETLNFNNEP